MRPWDCVPQITWRSEDAFTLTVAVVANVVAGVAVIAIVAYASAVAATAASLKVLIN